MFYELEECLFTFLFRVSLSSILYASTPRIASQQLRFFNTALEVLPVWFVQKLVSNTPGTVWEFQDFCTGFHPLEHTGSSIVLGAPIHSPSMKMQPPYIRKSPKLSIKSLLTSSQSFRRPSQQGQRLSLSYGIVSKRFSWYMSEAFLPVANRLSHTFSKSMSNRAWYACRGCHMDWQYPWLGHGDHWRSSGIISVYKSLEWSNQAHWTRLRNIHCAFFFLWIAFVRIIGSKNTTLNFKPSQRVVIKRTTSNQNLCIFFSRSEFDEVVDRVCVNHTVV